MIDILVGDCRSVLAALADRSVQCCVTSPPYFGLRDYGTATWDGGDAGCDHSPDRQPRGDRARSGLTGSTDYVSAQEPAFRDACGKCGATRTDSQIGLEQTPDAYVAEMVAVFREVRRVLRDDGTLWLNLGDSYAASGSGGGSDNSDHHSEPSGFRTSGRYVRSATVSAKQLGIKPKDLTGIPWLVAFALRADGWYLRQDIIWSKPNPMPESVTDRCTKAHEYVFLLSKSARYFYDAEAIREEAEYGRRSNFRGGGAYINQSAGQDNSEKPGKSSTTSGSDPSAGRNKRSVWTIATQPYSGAHFATMPPDLAETCIKAGSKLGDMILDPFGGAGTTALVADRLQRNATIIELNPTYAALARDRINGEAGLFSPVAAE